jgi:hypothetical protein
MNPERMIYGMPGLLIGFGVGYVIGSQKNLSTRDRIGLMVLVGAIGGLIVSLSIMTVFPLTSLDIFLGILMCIGGTAFGGSINWESSPPKLPQSHILFEPEDADEFDREIEEALSGNQS